MVIRRCFTIIHVKALVSQCDTLQTSLVSVRPCLNLVFVFDFFFPQEFTRFI